MVDSPLPSRREAELADAAARLVALWRPRLGIAEVVHVEVVDDAESTERELEARCIPIERDGEGHWEFTIQVGDTIESERLERAIVHELVHVIVEPLRRTFFYIWPDDRTYDINVRTETWETVVDRIADAYLRAYPVPVGSRSLRWSGGRAP
jgi:hypothetical protein